MNIAVIGLGSMGKRRIRLLKKYFPDYNIYGIEGDKSRAEECGKEFEISCFDNIKNAVDTVALDCAFVCTPPLTHSTIITLCLNNGMHIFTELNLVKDGYEINMQLAKEKGKILFLSSTALYRKEMNYINSKVKNHKKKLSYSYHVGQYLPDWHPWENYKKSFFSEERTNGCREILAIELPWILRAFGKVSDISVVSARLTDLEIEFDDYFNIQIRHENGCIGTIIVDVVCREAVRKLEVVGESLYLEWRGTPDTLIEKDMESKSIVSINLYDEIDRMEGYSSTIIENQYLDELKTFFSVLENGVSGEYGFDEDWYTLEIIDKIEGK